MIKNFELLRVYPRQWRFAMQFENNQIRSESRILAFQAQTHAKITVYREYRGDRIAHQALGCCRNETLPQSKNRRFETNSEVHE